MTTKKGGGLPSEEATATATETRPCQEADPSPQFTGSGGQAEPVTAADDHAAWIARLEQEQAEEATIRDAVHRLIARATCAHGILKPGSHEWYEAPATVQLASVAAWAGGEYLPETPMRQASKAISGALDWRREASRPSYAELQRRRSIPITPVRCQSPGCGRVHYLEHPLPVEYLCDHHTGGQRREEAA